ncbi:MAG: transcriptional repressor [Bacteroidales bacterium]|nr:transcriptional repressor [Bacteroidales bacterium]
MKRRSMKATPQRVAVHESMLRLVHASADQVFSDIQANSEAKLTRSTVYNVLGDMVRIGLYACRMGSSGKTFYDVFPGSHLHLYDCENHIFKDVTDEELSSLVKEHLSHKRFRGFTIENIDIQVVVRPTRRKK